MGTSQFVQDIIGETSQTLCEHLDLELIETHIITCSSGIGTVAVIAALASVLFSPFMTRYKLP